MKELYLACLFLVALSLILTGVGTWFFPLSWGLWYLALTLTSVAGTFLAGIAVLVLRCERP